jgi:hypothetical protein
MAGTVELVRQVLAAWLFAILMPGSIADLIRVRGLDRCPAEPARVDWSTFVALALGLAAAAWLAGRILRPRIVTGVLSSHPSYVVIDLVILALAWLMFDIGREPFGCHFAWEYWRGVLALAFALSIPIARLVAWYPLGLRVEQQRAEVARIPVLTFCLVAAIPLALGGIFYGQYLLARHRAPLADAATMAGGLAAHPALAGPVVRVVGTLKLSEAIRCRCRPNDPESCFQAEALLDLQGAGEVIVFGGPHDADELRKLAQRGAGKRLEVFGRLSRELPLPNRLCDPRGYGQLPEAGRAVLVMERP